jgi:hypothetical protein
MPIHTTESLRATRRRLNRERYRRDRNRLTARQVLANMRSEGLALHCSFENQGERWWLTNGRRIEVEVAHLVINDVNVTSVGDALFLNASPQTYRYIEN